MRSSLPQPFGVHAAAFQRTYKHVTGKTLAAERTSAHDELLGDRCSVQQQGKEEDVEQRQQITAPLLPDDLSSRDLPQLSDKLAFSLNVTR
jgi:hypothetical protein